MNNYSKNKITFLSDINLENIEIQERCIYYFFDTRFITTQIEEFIKNIQENDEFIITPFLFTIFFIEDKLNYVSEEFLINSNSDPQLICDFLIQEMFKKNKNLPTDFFEQKINLAFKIQKIENLED